MEEDGVRWDVVRSDLCHALSEVLHNGALTRDLHAAKDRVEWINGWQKWRVGGTDLAVSYVSWLFFVWFLGSFERSSTWS